MGAIPLPAKQKGGGVASWVFVPTGVGWSAATKTRWGPCARSASSSGPTIASSIRSSALTFSAASPSEVGIDVAGRAGDVDQLHPHPDRQAAQDVDAGDQRAAHAVARGERLERGRPPLAPEPDVRRRVPPFGAPGARDRVIGQQGGGTLHQVVDPLRARAARPVVRDRLVRDVVRRLAAQLHRRGVGQQQQVAIRDAGVELAPLRAERGAEVGHDPVGLGLRDVAGGEVLHPAVLDRHQVAAEDHLVRARAQPLGGGLDRRAAGVEAVRVVAHQRERADVGAGGEARGDRDRAAQLSARGDRVHVGDARGFQGRPAVELGQREVGGAVGEDDRVLHGPSAPRASRG
ncbi:MAG: hypothetical protein MUF27_15960 [Acidobacteria bacterium]|nr:hypothetical protein [Acidobacteriota bacterium]